MKNGHLRNASHVVARERLLHVADARVIHQDVQVLVPLVHLFIWTQIGQVSRWQGLLTIQKTCSQNLTRPRPKM